MLRGDDVPDMLLWEEGSHAITNGLLCMIEHVSRRRNYVKCQDNIWFV